jgi:hypothetical protein
MDRFEGRNRPGSGLFFILITFLCLNLKKKYALAMKIFLSKELLSFGGLLERDVLTHALHGSKESWNHYHPEDV